MTMINWDHFLGMEFLAELNVATNYLLVILSISSSSRSSSMRSVSLVSGSNSSLCFLNPTQLHQVLYEKVVPFSLVSCWSPFLSSERKREPAKSLGWHSWSSLPELVILRFKTKALYISTFSSKSVSLRRPIFESQISTRDHDALLVGCVPHKESFQTETL